MKYNDEIEILISSDCDYEQLVAEIQYPENLVIILNQDKGKDNIDLVLENYKNKKCIQKTILNLDDFINSIIAAKKC